MLYNDRDSTPGNVNGVTTSYLNDTAATESLAVRIARQRLCEVRAALYDASGADCVDLLHDAAYEIGRLIGHGYLDRSDAADVLTSACIANGLSAEAGPDVVQDQIAEGFSGGCSRSYRRTGIRG